MARRTTVWSPDAVEWISTRGKRGSRRSLRWWKCTCGQWIVSTNRRRLSPMVPRVYERPTAIERPRTIPHTGHWGHITLPTYIQSLLIYIYYSLAPLFIVFRGDARRTGTLICTNWKLWSATEDKSHPERKRLLARELFDAEEEISRPPDRFAISSTYRQT